MQSTRPAEDAVYTTRQTLIISLLYLLAAFREKWSIFPSAFIQEAPLSCWIVETNRIGIVGHAGHVSSSEIRNREKLNHGASDSLRTQRLQKAHVCHESCFLWSAQTSHVLSLAALTK